MRPLSGREKWRISGLCESKAEWLIANGHDDQLGPLAGNSIPARMTEAVVVDEMLRVSRYKQLLLARSKGDFVTMAPKAGLFRSDLALTLLVFVGHSRADVLVWNESETPGMVHSVSQQQAFDLACKWAAQRWATACC